MIKLQVCCHTGTRNKFHFEILSKILNITFDQEIQLPKFILRKQLYNFAKMYIQAWSSKDSNNSKKANKKNR